MNCIWKMSYGTVVTAVFKMTINSICPHFWASYDISGDELLDVGIQPAPPSHFLPWQWRTCFFIPGDGLLLSPSPQTDVAPFDCFLPVFNNRSWFSLHSSDSLGSVPWHPPVQDQNLFTAWDVLAQGGSSFPEETRGWPLGFGNVVASVHCKTIDSRQSYPPQGLWRLVVDGDFVFKAAFMSLQTALVVESSLVISTTRSSPDMTT